MEHWTYYRIVDVVNDVGGNPADFEENVARSLPKRFLAFTGDYWQLYKAVRKINRMKFV